MGIDLGNIGEDLANVATFGGYGIAKGLWNAAQGAVNSTHSSGTGGSVQGPLYGDYEYHSNHGAANGTENYYTGLANTTLQNQAAQISNPYQAGDQARLNQNYASQNALQNQQGQMAQYYQSVLNGTHPSLAAAQMQAATDQSIQAQMAMANSAKGGLAGALAQRNAAQQGVGMQQNAAQQSMQGRLQEEQAAQAGLQGLYGQMGQQQLGMGQQALSQAGQNTQEAEAQAQLQAQQNALNQQGSLAYQQLAQQTALAQMAGRQAYSQAGIGVQEANAGMTQQNNQFNAQQNTQLITGLMGMAGGGLGAAAMADADLVEPDGPAHWTLREERDFILAKNQRTGELRKLVTEPLSRDEIHQAMARHGAGPLGADDPRRTRTIANDLTMLGSDDGSLMDAMQQAAGPANPDGSYTPQLSGPDPSIANVLQGSDWASNLQGPAGDSGRLRKRLGHGLMGAGQSLMQQARGMGGQPMSIAPYLPKIPSYADLDMRRPSPAAMMSGMQGLQQRYAALNAARGM